MKYSGRIFVCLISILILILWLIYRFLTGKLSDTYYESFILIIIIQPMLWWLGKQYDKGMYHQKELKKFELAMESSLDGIAILNDKGEYEYMNEAHADIYGYKLQELLNCSWKMFYDNEYLDWISMNVFPVIEKEGSWSGELIGIKKDGTPFPQQISLSKIKVTNGMVCVVRNITTQKDVEEKLKYTAYHDNLTGLPNRDMFTKHLQIALDRCKRNHQELAVMFIDLDRFKFINDTLGHDIGDELLRQVSNRLIKSVREGDVVARQGGDEFIILLEDTEQSEVNEIAERILNEFTTPFILDSKEFFTSPSIGISVYPNNGQDIVTLTKHADKAMYLAKKRGKNTYQFYIQEDEDLLNRKAKLEQGLKRALDNKEFELYYQPKVELATRNIYGVEALLRWNHPELGFIPPIEFIPIAEETGMIIPIGKWVLQEACKQNKLWQASGIWIKMNVNASSIQLEDNHFVELVKEVLAASQLPPEYLGIEITESVMQDINHSTTIIHELKKVGIKISIDDFGTGYSSLSVINNLPIDVVKIDKSFVNEIMTNSNIASLVKTMIQMGENLEFDLIAEGIENEQQAKFLIENGCRLGQGYLYSQPLKKDEIEILLNKQLKSS